MIDAWQRGFDWIILIVLGVWSISPYLLLIAYTLKMRSVSKSSIITLIGSLIIMLFGVAILADGLFIHRDALNGLLLLFMPPFQLVAVLITVGISYWKEY
jgi:biotin transporter BioY